MNQFRNRLLVGDASTELARVPSGVVDQVVTSPPYFRLRDYQVAGQLGLEATVAEWADGLRRVAAELRRVLVPTGSLWLNLGDSYATHPREGAPCKSLLLGPERVALALVADGWILRNKLIWQKANPMPTSVRDRLACTWEVIYIFSAKPRYYFDLDALRLPHTSRPPRQPRAGGPVRQPARAAWLGPNADDTGGLVALKASGRVGHPAGRNPGDIWRLATSQYRGAHHATFPAELARRMITAGSPALRCSRCRAPYRQQRLAALGVACPPPDWQPTCGCGAAAEAGLVLDPFFGAGTTGLAAGQLGRDWLGIELNPTFARAARVRLAEARAGPAAA